MPVSRGYMRAQYPLLMALSSVSVAHARPPQVLRDSGAGATVPSPQLSKPKRTWYTWRTADMTDMSATCVRFWLMLFRHDTRGSIRSTTSTSHGELCCTAPSHTPRAGRALARVNCAFSCFSGTFLLPNKLLWQHATHFVMSTFGAAETSSIQIPDRLFNVDPQLGNQLPVSLSPHPFEAEGRFLVV